MYAKVFAAIAALLISASGQPQGTTPSSVGSQSGAVANGQSATSPVAGGAILAQLANCTSGCPPHWMSTLDGFLLARGLPTSLKANSPLCDFSRSEKTLFTACNSPEGSLCKTSPVNFRCCPIECLTTIKECYNGPPSDSLCVPSVLQPWTQKIMSMVLSNMAYFGTSG